jgi:hypothetical protein
MGLERFQRNLRAVGAAGGMSNITPNQWTILEALKDGPRWARSFQMVKPLVEDLVARSLVERCRPHLGAARNMVRLTDAGCAALEIDPASVPLKRDEPKANSKAHRPHLGSIRADVTPRLRAICETFLRRIKDGVGSQVAVGELAAMHDVQRPAIWKSLRSGGVIAPYAPSLKGGKGRPRGGGEPGYSHRRREKSLACSEARNEPRSDQYVDRDPCPRCGVRGDYGCAHTRAPLGTSF